MKDLEIAVQKREKTGNGPARALRREGRIPAILYGKGKDPVNLSVVHRDLVNVLKKADTTQVVMNLKVEGEDSDRFVMIKELQKHPLSGKILHSDFYEVSMDKKITVRIPVVTRGKAPGVELGGLLSIIRRELDILCLPVDIPKEIVVDISSLELGKSLHLHDIELGEGLSFPEEGVNFTVITIVSPTKAEADGDEEGDEEEDAASEED